MQIRIENNIKRSVLFCVGLFCMFFVLSFLAFYKGWNTGWNYDSIGFSYLAKKNSLSTLLSLHIDKTSRFVYHTVYYLLNKYFGYQGWDWFLFKIALHAFNALLLLIVVKLILQYYASINNYAIPILTALLFLLAPTTTEVVLYQAAIQFLFTYSLLYLCILLVIFSIRSGKKAFVWIYFALFFIALFSLETSYTFPAIAFLLVAFYPGIKIKSKQTVLVVLIPILFVLSVLFINYALFGDSLSHYGQQKHLNISLDKLIQNMLKIPLDFIAFIEYWKMDYIYKVYNILYKKEAIYLFAVLFILIYLSLWKKYLNDQLSKPFWMCIHILFVMILPTIALGILYIIPIEEDRYLYYPSGMVFFCIVWVLYKISPKLMYAGVACLLFIGFLFLQKNIYSWTITQKTIDYSLSSFPYEKGKRYILLASPVYANGVLIWDTHETDKDPFEDKYQILGKALYVKQNIDVMDKIAPVLQYNIINEKESPEISTLNDSTLKMTLPCCGKWWWKHNSGAQDMETDYYKIKMVGGWQQEVHIQFKQKPKDLVYIYQCGTQFCKYDF